MRVYDISSVQEPVEVAYCVPPRAQRVNFTASSALVPQSADLVVSADGLVIASDLNAGLSIMVYEGA